MFTNDDDVLKTAAVAAIAAGIAVKNGWNPLKKIEQAAELVDKLGLNVDFIAKGITGTIEVTGIPNNYWKKFVGFYMNAEGAVAAYCEAVTRAAEWIGLTLLPENE
jgi:formylmethanofuran dehydrogenase subunit B